MDTKLTFTIYDILTSILPGGLILLLFRIYFGFGSNLSDSVLLFLLVTGGYVLGSIANLFGLLLFWPVYPHDFKTSHWYSIVNGLEKTLTRLPLLRIKRVDDKTKEKLIERVKERFGIDFTNDRLGLFNFTDTLIASSNFAERDMLLAKEGFFRTLTCLAFSSTIYLLITQPASSKWYLGLIGILATELLRFGREYFRVLKNQQVYALALIKLQENDSPRKHTKP